MNSETIKGLKEAKGHIEIDINGMQPKVSLQLNNSEGLLISISALISTTARLGNMSEWEVILGLVEFCEHTHTFTADSQEQADVMEQILKRGGKIDDLM